MNRALGPGPVRAQVVAVAAAIALFVVGPLLDPLSLVPVVSWDSATLLIYNMDHDGDGNVDEWDAAPLEPTWDRTMGTALVWGGLPAFVLIVAGLLLRIWAWRTKQPHPWSRWPRRVRWGALALALASVAIAAWPLGLALSVWGSLEVFWWIEWYYKWEFFEENALFVPTVVSLGVVLVGIVAIRLALPPARRPGRLRRVAWGVLLAPTFAVILVGTVVAAVRLPRVAALPGYDAFEKHCKGCHELALPFDYIRTPPEWERTFVMHERYGGIELTPQERSDLMELFLGMRSFPDDWTFRTRCQRCHVFDWDDWAPRPREEWAAIVDRLARWSPYYYRPELREAIVDHLVATIGEGPGIGADERLLVDACGRCHSVSIEAERWVGASEADVLEMVRRMNRKLPERLGDAEVETLTDLWRGVIADPERLRRVVPHDRPVEGGLPW